MLAFELEGITVTIDARGDRLLIHAPELEQELIASRLLGDRRPLADIFCEVVTEDALRLGPGIVLQELGAELHGEPHTFHAAPSLIVLAVRNPKLRIAATMWERTPKALLTWLAHEPDFRIQELMLDRASADVLQVLTRSRHSVIREQARLAQGISEIAI